MGTAIRPSYSWVVVLVLNGEIYNFRDLRKDLKAKGHKLRGHSDTEVLLNLYLAEGEAMLPRLNGIFAFTGPGYRRVAPLPQLSVVPWRRHGAEGRTQAGTWRGHGGGRATPNGRGRAGGGVSSKRNTSG